jgi:hypothetical protein
MSRIGKRFLNRFVSRSLIQLRDVLLVVLGAFLGTLGEYLPPDVLIVLSLSVTVVLMIITEVTRVDPRFMSDRERELMGALGGEGDRSASRLGSSGDDMYVSKLSLEPECPVIGEQELSRDVSTGSMPQSIMLEINQAIVTITAGSGLSFDPTHYRMAITWSLSRKTSSNAGMPRGPGCAVSGD